MNNKKKCPVCDFYLEENSYKCENCGTIITYFNNENNIPNKKSNNGTTKLKSEEVFSFLTTEKKEKPKDINLIQINLPFYKEKTLEKILFFSKSRLLGWLFDILLVTFLWFLTQIFASIILQTTIFNLISSSYPKLIIFYLILLMLYLFLFILFFKRTLGEFIFSKKD
ncbi:hypothetical protein NLC29_02005 [Candidatus Aminicenantes bacterium AH-873-B07]|jgi:ABC-type bacteriocin/lantibiotic exporter with double-glycine peptidase domain|nr:hypothetical protein [Candidatus Aminicenantes bacterium AH-873-B07]